MNILLFELKAQLKSFVIWSAVIILTLIALMSGMYPVFYDSLELVTDMLKNFPPEFAAAFGLYLDDLFSYGGFFSFSFLYISLMGVIMAVILSVSAFAREKRSKCVDFLLTKPRTRSSVFISKLLSGLLLLVVFNLTFIAAAMIGYYASSGNTGEPGRFLLAAFSLFPTQLVFYCAGILFAILARRVRSVSGAATAFGFAGFLLSALYGMLEEEPLRFVTPLKYFDPAAVITSGGYEARYAVTGLLIAAVCVAASYIRFCKSDTPAI
jgi:ABC-2 type transport system permease protein